MNNIIFKILGVTVVLLAIYLAITYISDNVREGYASDDHSYVKPMYNYGKPWTNLFFDEHMNFITLQDSMPNINAEYNMKRIPCPEYYLYAYNYERPENMDYELVCWQLL